MYVCIYICIHMCWVLTCCYQADPSILYIDIYVNINEYVCIHILLDIYVYMDIYVRALFQGRSMCHIY